MTGRVPKLVCWRDVMSLWTQRLPAALLAMVLVAAPVGCGGSAYKKDARQLEKICDVVRGNPVDEGQAICIGRLYGIKKKRNCPIEVDSPGDFGVSVFRIRESCSGLGVIVAESSGRVLALVSNDEIIHE